MTALWSEPGPTAVLEHGANPGLISHFTKHALGLPDPNHYMSAHDIATLARALIQDFPEHYARYSVRSFKYNNIEQQNRNRLLLTDSSVDGVKTGHTESAGYCLVSSAKRNDTRLIGVVLGADKEKNRFVASQALLNYGFSFFESHKLHDADTPIVTTRIWKGKENELPLGVTRPLYVTVPKGQAPQVSTTTTVQSKIIAPAQKDQPFGEIVIKLGDQEVSKIPLVALKDVPESGWFGRIRSAPAGARAVRGARADAHWAWRTCRSHRGARTRRR